MSVANRELKAGVRLVGRYQGKRYVCEVVESADGLRCQLEDGQRFGSLSAAGRAVMGGIGCNGWRFWSVGEPAEGTPRPARSSRRALLPRQVRKLPNQQKVPAGQARWFCSGCMAAFLVPAGDEPDSCPEGHPARAEA